MISLSNLLKQYYCVQTSQNGSLVINSNPRVEEKLQDLFDEYRRRELQEDGMEESSEEELPEDPEEEQQSAAITLAAQKEASRIVDAANRQSSVILDKAKIEAEEILSNANAQAMTIYENQKEAGFQSGVQEGEKSVREKELQLEEEFKIRSRQLEEQLEQERSAMLREMNQKRDQMEEEIVDVVVQVVEKVFAVQFEEKKPILLHLIKQTLQSVESSKEFKIRVSQENRSYVEEHINEIRGIVGNDITLEVVLDPGLTEDGCRIETEYGVFDCSIDTELSNLIKDIRSLCSQGR